MPLQSGLGRVLPAEPVIGELGCPLGGGFAPVAQYWSGTGQKEKSIRRQLLSDGLGLTISIIMARTLNGRHWIEMLVSSATRASRITDR